MCMFLTILYFGFAALTFAYSNKIIKENEIDLRDNGDGQVRNHHQTSFTGFIDNRFDVRSSNGKQNGYVVPQETVSSVLV